MDEAKPKRKRDEFIDDFHDEPGLSAQVWNLFVRVLAFCVTTLIIAPLHWLWRQILRLLRFSWNLGFAILRWTWGFTGRVLNFTIDKSIRAVVWTVRAPFRLLGWLWHWLFGGAEPDDPMQALRWRIKRRYRRRNRFITHVFAFVGVNGFTWWTFLGYLSRGYYFDPWFSSPIGFTLLWAVALLFHHVRARMGDAEDSAMEAALERQTAWKTPYVVEDEVVYDERYSRLADRAMVDYPVDERLKQKRKRG